MRIRHLFVHLGLVPALCVLALTPTPATGGPAAPGGPPAAPGAGGDKARALDGYTVTLLTGDRVRVSGVGERRTVEVIPAEGREGIEVLHQEVDGDLVVLPRDVIAYVGSKAVDIRLFNVDELRRQGLTEPRTSVIPVIATYESGLRVAATDRLPGTTTGTPLRSVGGVGVDVDADRAQRFWESVSAPLGTRTADRGRLGGGIERLWLNARVEAQLDRSVPHIGAPTAWEAGFEGEGVRVAVLDTGVDASHPDLAGRVVEQANFSSSPTVADAFGHGTHVASTIAGTGVASPAARRGVAPQADILSGKVLGDDGSGFTDDIIAAMEWAVAEEADVVNLSLGGPGDGTDVLSLALDELSATSDTLFVASAGNEGPGAFSVGSPGSADSALTVGAVDLDDEIAGFSSRGPRANDLAVKPDITAPGVRIAAARAAGTTMGDVVDEQYVVASGTSMAAPHVAGAAALLAQQHPDWDGEQLKDALMSSSLPLDGPLDTYGLGRVDVTRAMSQPFFATGTLALGEYDTEDTEPIVRTITYTNTGDQPVDLTLEADLRTATGEAPPAGAVDLSQDQVTVPAGGTAEVTLEIDVAALSADRYTGTLTASSSSHQARTALSLSKTPPMHEVSISAVDQQGAPTQSPVVVVLFGQDRRHDVIMDLSGSTTVELPEGDYFLHSSYGDVIDGDEVAFVYTDPDLEITDDTSLVIDLRTTRPIRIRTPQPAEQRGMLGFVTHRKVGSRNVSNHTNRFDNTTSVWVNPTEPAKGGDFEFTSRWQLQAPMLTASVPGSKHQLWPNYLNTSPLLEGRRDLRVVDVGAGTPADYDGRDVRGAIAWVSERGERDDEAMVAAAEAAGAEMLLVSVQEGRYAFTDWQPGGERLPLYAAILSPDESDRLEAAMGERAGLRLTLRGEPASPFLYDVLQVSSGQVADGVVHDVATTSARIDTAYRDNGSPWVQEQRFAWRPWQEYTVIETQRDVPTATRRTEWVTGGDTLWRHHVMPFPSYWMWSPIRSGMFQDTRSYAVGEDVEETWLGSVVRPAVPAAASQDRMTSYRNGAELELRMPTFADSDAGHYGFGEEGSFGAVGDTVTAEVFEDGALVASSESAWGSFPVEKAAADYEVRLTVERPREDWRHSTRTVTTWGFRSDAAGDPGINLLSVDYEVPADEHNAVPAGRRTRLGFGVRPSPGAPAAALTSVRSWISYDDGATWQELGLSRTGDGTYAGTVRTPRTPDGGFATLKVEAEDAAGNRVSQTVERAFSVRP